MGQFIPVKIFRIFRRKLLRLFQSLFRFGGTAGKVSQNQIFPVIVAGAFRSAFDRLVQQGQAFIDIKRTESQVITGSGGIRKRRVRRNPGSIRMTSSGVGGLPLRGVPKRTSVEEWSRS